MAATFSAEWTVRRARDAYLEENGFTLQGYDARWTDASFFGLPLRVLNTRRHRWAIMLHDLHHVATGYGTDLAGEGEISAWELRGGIRNLGVYVAAIVASVAATGGVLAPRSVLRAWRDAAGARSLFSLLPPEDDDAYAALLDRPVGELRARLGLPENGIAREPRRLHDFAPRRVAAAELSTPVLAELPDRE